MTPTPGNVLAMGLAAALCALSLALALGAMLHLAFGEWAGWFSSPALVLFLFLFARKWWLWATKGY